MRALLAIAASIGFLAAWRKPAARPAAVLFAILGVTSGQLHRIGWHVFPSQPLAFRWIVFFGLVSLVVLATLFRLIAQIRDSSPEAAGLLEWSLAPATLASLIVIGNIFWRPYLTPGWDLLANVSGIAAMGLALLAAVAFQR
jgi:hypothetical protein